MFWFSLDLTVSERRSFKQRRAEQINGREGETATLLSRFLVKSGGLSGGFAPRHLNRSTFLLVC